MIELEILTQGGAWSGIADIDALARRALAATLEAAPPAPDEPIGVSLLLTDDAGMRALNRTWRGKDEPTNVLSFPAAAAPVSQGPHPLGDIALAFETVAGEAAAQGKSVDDHVAHLLVHGMLHLLGHDHEDEAQAEAMEAIEIEALAHLGVANPYRDVAA